MQTMKSLLGLAVLVASASAQTAKPRARACLASAAEVQFCEQAVQVLNTVPDTDALTWSCAAPVNRTGTCTQDVAAGNTDFMVTGSSGILDAYTAYQLQAIVAEDLGSGDAATYYSIAVVRRQYCETQDAAAGFAGLRGKSMCSTGYGRTAGWTMPVGYLADAGLLNATNTKSSIRNDAFQVGAFFSDVCAANNNTMGPIKLPGQNFTSKYPELCQACGDPANCSNSDRYWSYEGAFRGVVEGSCTVAFTREDIPADYTTGGALAANWSEPASNFRLLCPDGGCRNVSDYADCTAAKVPARAVLVRASYNGSEALQNAIVAMRENPTVADLVFNETSNPNDYFFQASVESFLPIDSSTPAYLGASGRAIQGVAALNSGASAPSASVASSGRRL